MGESYLVPASSSHIAKIIGSSFKLAKEGWLSPYTGKTIRFNWWEEGSPFRYTHLLCSAHYGIREPNYRKINNLPDDLVIISDSGGFQIATRELMGIKLDYDPQKVLKWQEDNSNIAIGLDSPTAIGPIRATDEVFKRKCEFLYKNNQIYEKSRNNPKCQIYNVLHGEDLDRLEYWYNAQKEFKFDGWASAVKPPWAPMKMAFGAMFLYSKGIRKNLHVLGTTGIDVIPVLAYISNFIDNVTYDSATFGQGAMSRLFMTPLTLKWDMSFGDNTNVKNLKDIPCGCPICQNMTLKELNAPGSLGGVSISAHNLYWILEYSKMMNRLKVEKKIFMKFIKDMCNPETLHAIDFVDITIEKGFDAAYQKYRMHEDLFRWKPDKPDQPGLFNLEEVEKDGNST